MTKLLISPQINDYAEQQTTPETPELAALNRETHLKIQMPVMLSGHLQGAVLQMLSSMIRPKNILEIGTYTGYSAICLSKGLTEDGKLHTIDINEELSDMCNRYFKTAGVDSKIIQHIGNAADIIPTINESFDLVFIDADKQSYSRYFDLVIEKIPVGAFIIADNVLYNGEVTLPESDQSKNARAIHTFNEKIKNDDRVAQVLLPVRDGLLIVQKIKKG